jgi:NAD(P)-dependent dehydrogenase (short-subunit alcohol dehydrogenase family)
VCPRSVGGSRCSRAVRSGYRCSRAADQKPDKLPKFGADSPLGRPGQPAEIAPLYVLLAGAQASFVSGNILSCTGGRPAG